MLLGIGSFMVLGWYPLDIAPLLCFGRYVLLGFGRGGMCIFVNNPVREKLWISFRRRQVCFSCESLKRSPPAYFLFLIERLQVKNHPINFTKITE